MMSPLPQHPYVLHEFVMNHLPLDLESVLDIGCGRGVWGFLMRTSREIKYLIGVDINHEYLHFAKHHHIYDDLVLASAQALPFRNKAIEGTLAIEVLEHLPKKDGFSLLDEIDRITVKLAILTTPNGYLPSPKPSNVFEIHRAGWQSTELISRGYRVFGIGLKLYQKYPSRLTYVFQSILMPLTYFLKIISAHLLAVKNF